MNKTTEAIVYPYYKNLLEKPAAGSSLLFLRAENPGIIQDGAVLIQARYDKAAVLIAAGHDVLAEPPPDKKFDTVWVLPGKDRQETQFLLAQALRSAKQGGVIVAAAPNDAGGKRLAGLFETLGLLPETYSKHKAQIVFAVINGKHDETAATDWLEAGKEQLILGGTALSRPGLHSWDRADEGSALLARHLPSDLGGTVADFGCGWGYLSLQAGQTSKHIKRLTLIDIDARAVDLAERNVRKRHPALPVSAIWTDLAAPGAQFGPFDAILLNPPFHEGTRAVPALGQAIIATAARSLAPKGRLFLVANKHLPYEKMLRELFSEIHILAEEKGFKTLVCNK